MELPSVDDFPHVGFRANREILYLLEDADSAGLTVFVGLYNATPYLDGLLRQVESQRGSDVRWLFVDNASSDDTWERIKAWAETSTLRTTLIRNAFNLGATGSIFVNMDLVTTEWVTFMHQDDFYLPTHFSTLAIAAETSPEGTVGVFSDMSRASDRGRRIGAYPPPIWMVPDLDPPTVFLALLRNHGIPWPTLAVKTRQFRETEAPWHSTAFPDTEITMRLAARGTFVHVNKETMAYRDNAKSESRSIDDRERKFGATVSLFRVFNSAEFEMLATAAVDETDRTAFAIGLRDAILVRLGRTERAALVITGALERLSQLWDNGNPAVLAELSTVYQELGAVATSGLLDRMASASGGDPEEESKPFSIRLDLPASTSPTRPDALGKFTALVSGAYKRLGFLIPYRVRQFAARRVIRHLAKDDPLSPWRFDWR